MKQDPKLHALLLVPLFIACGETSDHPGRTDYAPGIDPVVSQRILERAREDVFATGALLGLGFASNPVEDMWLGASGLADRETQQVLMPDDRFRVASITKLFIAVVTLQLVQEGKLSLDAPISQWRPRVPASDAITVRHLLEHTSGLFNYTESEIVEQPDAIQLSPDDILSIAIAQAPTHAPGEAWAYTNTGYLLLGIIIEDVTQQSWSDGVRARILEPLGMASTFIDGRETVLGGYVSGYAFDVETGTYLDVSTSGWANVADSAGAMVSTTRDLLRFMQGLMTGDLLTDETLNAMMAPKHLVLDVEGLQIHGGMGLFILETDTYTSVGHGGDLPGYSAWLGYVPEHDILHASMVNTQPNLPTLSFGYSISEAWLNHYFAGEATVIP